MEEISFGSLEEAKECLKDYEQAIKVGGMLERLKANPDFKNLILDGFCTKLCSDYVARSVNERLSTDVRDLALSAAKAGGHLNNYLNILKYKSDTAKDNIEVLRNYIDNYVATNN